MNVNWDDYSQYMEKYIMLQTTNQIGCKNLWPRNRDKCRQLWRKELLKFNERKNMEPCCLDHCVKAT